MTPYYDPSFAKKAPSWGSENISGYGDSSTFLDENPRSGGSSMQQGNLQGGIAGVQAGLAAGAANGNPVSDFNIDQYAGFKGSLSGGASGLAAAGPIGGIIGAVIGGAVSQVGQFSKVNKNLKKLNTNVDSLGYDAYGRPVYQGAGYASADANVGALNEGLSKMNKTHIDPATNVLGSAFGTRRKIKRKRNELIRNQQSSQRRFNQADLNYRTQSLQRDEYLERMNPQQRISNIYR
jgi:hypothetical protein